MNILPLILALVLMLTVLTVEKLEKFKNQTLIQTQYQAYLKESERQAFNSRQAHLYGDSNTDLKQLSFRYFLDQSLREKDADKYQQNRLIAVDLLKILYSDTAFYKEIAKKRPDFIEELLTAIEKASSQLPIPLKRIEDISRLSLDDPELQQAFYYMLKGTVTHEQMKELKAMTDPPMSPRMREKAYVSLLTYINFADKRIMIQHSPSVILKAIFGNDEVVDAIITRRNELRTSENSGDKTAFENEFKEKVRPGIKSTMLDFEISKTDKTKYN
jgi:hypothetical protein